MTKQSSLCPFRSIPPALRAEHARHEDDVLERIVSIVGRHSVPEGEHHIGDDAAVLAPFVGEALVSTDVAVLGVHLDGTLFPLEDLGFKAVASAVSDLAAMGGRPRGAVIAVSAPVGTDLEELHRGIADAAAMTGCPIVGGDLTQARDVSGGGDRVRRVPRSRRGPAKRRSRRRRPCWSLDRSDARRPDCDAVAREHPWTTSWSSLIGDPGPV